jgi:hypothetical protein
LEYKELYLKQKWFSDAEPQNPKCASATLSFNAGITAGEVVTIGDENYEFVAEATDATAGNIAVVVGETLTADKAIQELTKAINANSAIVTAVDDTEKDTCTILYKSVGTDGNAVGIETTTAGASFSDSATKLGGGQYGTPCMEVNSIIYASPHYYWCTAAGNKDDVEWKKFTPASY